MLTRTGSATCNSLAAACVLRLGGGGTIEALRHVPHQISYGEARPRPRCGGAYNSPPDSLAGFKGPTSTGGEGEIKKGAWRGDKGKEMEKRERNRKGKG